MTRSRIESHLPAHRSLMVSDMRGAPPDEPCGPVIHPHAALSLLIEGEVRVSCGSTYALRPGDLLLVPEGMPHFSVAGAECASVGMALCTSCVTSSAGGARLAAAFAEVSEGASAQRTLDAEDAARLAATLRALGDELAAERPWQSLAVEGHLAVIAALVLRAAPAAKALDGRAPEASVSAQALGFITRRALHGISLADVARHVHRSPAHTAAVVKAETGRTVVGWITHARLATARQLLLRTDDTVEGVGARVGFASASHFHRTFRREHGLTPAEWRSAHRG